MLSANVRSTNTTSPTIQRYQNSLAKKLGILAEHVFMHALSLGFLLLVMTEWHIVGMLLFGVIYAYMVSLTVTLFIRGGIHEVYLLSDKTLAILHPRRPTRFLKPDDLVAYRARFRDFKRRDASKVSIYLVNREREFADELMGRWYGQNDMAADDFSGTITLQVSNGTVSDTILRFPSRPPNTARHVGGYFALLVLPIAVIALPVAIVLREVSFDRDMAVLMVLATLFILPAVTYIAVRCYKLFLRGDLYTTILISRSTVAIVHPRRRTRFIKRDEFVAYLPAYQMTSGRFLLKDESHVQFGFSDVLSQPLGPTMTLQRRWWPYVPLNQWTLSFYRLFAIIGTAAVGLMMFILGTFESLGPLTAGGTVLMAGATGGYLFGTVLGIGGVKTVPLRPEFYSMGLPPVPK